MTELRQEAKALFQQNEPETVQGRAFFEVTSFGLPNGKAMGNFMQLLCFACDHRVSSQGLSV